MPVRTHGEAPAGRCQLPVSHGNTSKSASSRAVECSRMAAARHAPSPSRTSQEARPARRAGRSSWQPTKTPCVFRASPCTSRSGNGWPGVRLGDSSGLWAAREVGSQRAGWLGDGRMWLSCCLGTGHRPRDQALPCELVEHEEGLLVATGAGATGPERCSHRRGGMR